MKRARLRRAARLLRHAAACALVAAAGAHACAQTPAGSPTPPAPARESGAVADEDFELSIDLRRISEADYHAETDVEAGGAQGLLLRVGVALRASDVEVLLRNVRGRVRFRGSLAPLLRLLDARRERARPAQPLPP